jgi:hypothetical protein
MIFFTNYSVVAAGTNPCLGNYAGMTRDSEPETYAIIEGIYNQTETSWDSYISLKGFGNLWLTPYAYSRFPPNEWYQQQQIAEIATIALNKVHNNTFQSGPYSIFYGD